jgi:hypothetical protein
MLSTHRHYPSKTEGFLSPFLCLKNLVPPEGIVVVSSSLLFLLPLLKNRTDLSALEVANLESIPETVENTDPFAVALENIKYVHELPDAANNLLTLDQAIMLALWYRYRRREKITNHRKAPL